MMFVPVHYMTVYVIKNVKKKLQIISANKKAGAAVNKLKYYIPSLIYKYLYKSYLYVIGL